MVMITVDNQVGFVYSASLLERVHTSLTDRAVELVLTDNTQIQTLNQMHRGVDKATDVLSFPLEEVPFMPLGTIVISVDKVREKAEEYGHTTDEELALLYLHGLLHLLGYDHEVDTGQMRRKEEEVIRQLALPESLIIRTQ